ncbi:hypothetical protein EG68_03888 [Paragonimus skrjabini miyazakii]|uniref:Uncharacterized protein n=1 Tax=Paragonimus skrjabini miyazakii TaxID=59628 RepID=A0A8S9Z0A4_9TREM|nr:hypothetical protein EG68_03888 [Paragonimus skrjabini miyazakii]
MTTTCDNRVQLPREESVALFICMYVRMVIIAIDFTQVRNQRQVLPMRNTFCVRNSSSCVKHSPFAIHHNGFSGMEVKIKASWRNQTRDQQAYQQRHQTRNKQAPTKIPSLP